jgi:hypothetical protein
VTSYRFDGQDIQFPAGAGIFLLVIMSVLSLGSTQPPMQWVHWDLSPALKQTDHETDHSPIHPYGMMPNETQESLCFTSYVFVHTIE